MVLMSTGKNTIKAQINTLENTPYPNHSTSSGAIATMGIAWLATRYGERTLSSARDFATEYPRIVARPTPAIKPSKTSESVTQTSNNKSPFVVASTKRSHTARGGGRMNVARPLTCEVICQHNRPNPSERARSHNRLRGEEDEGTDKRLLFIKQNARLESTNGAQNRTEAEPDRIKIPKTRCVFGEIESDSHEPIP